MGVILRDRIRELGGKMLHSIMVTQKQLLSMCRRGNIGEIRTRGSYGNVESSPSGLRTSMNVRMQIMELLTTLSSRKEGLEKVGPPCVQHLR